MALDAAIKFAAGVRVVSEGWAALVAFTSIAAGLVVAAAAILAAVGAVVLTLSVGATPCGRACTAPVSMHPARPVPHHREAPLGLARRRTAASGCLNRSASSSRLSSVCSSN
jgi:hypothetical protein